MKNSFYLILFTALTTMVVFSGSGCRRSAENSENLLKIDSLQHLLGTIDETLILDEDHFQSRKDSMHIKLNAIHANYKDTADGETKAAIVLYGGIERNYDFFLKTYPIMEFDLDNHKKIVDNLKQRIMEKSISQNEFDKSTQSEFIFLEGLLQKARTTTRNTYSIEGDYRRMNPVITKICDKLPK